MTINIGGVTQSDSAKLKLRHPITREPIIDDDKVQAFIELWSQDAEPYKERVRKKYDDRLAHAASEPVAQTSQRIEDDQLDLLIFAVKDWNLSLDDGPFPPTEANVRKLFKDPRFGWVREQADSFFNARASFIGASREP